MNWRLIWGGALFVVSIVPVVQTVRAMRFWDAGAASYAEVPLQTMPFEFGGHTVAVQDSLPVWSTASEEAVPGRATVFMDGSAIFSDRPAQVRPGRRRADLGRYHLWLDASLFIHRSTGDTMFVLGQRLVGDSADRFALLTIRKDGSTAVRLVSYSSRAEDYPTYRTVQFLRDESGSVYPFDLSGVWPSIAVPILYPLVTCIVGLLVLSWEGVRFFRTRPVVHEPSRAA